MADSSPVPTMAGYDPYHVVKLKGQNSFVCVDDTHTRIVGCLDKTPDGSLEFVPKWHANMAAVSRKHALVCPFSEPVPSLDSSPSAPDVVSRAASVASGVRGSLVPHCHKIMYHILVCVCVCACVRVRVCVSVCLCVGVIRGFVGFVGLIWSQGSRVSSLALSCGASARPSLNHSGRDDSGERFVHAPKASNQSKSKKTLRDEKKAKPSRQDR
jgi:hypothetical protein